jgi:5-formyltetrahydrofolate cyclo-ligase
LTAALWANPHTRLKPMDGTKIRSRLREQRRSLSACQQNRYADQITSILTRQDFFLRAKRVGVYLANDGEVDLSPIVDICLKSKKNCYLPVLHPLGYKRLHFATFDHHSPMTTNRFGISEPSLKHAKLVATWSLDLILMPLVGFDRHGNRLGMGGGYYDRTLSFMSSTKNPAPKLVGLSYSFQELHKIVRQDWDIPLNHIVTEREIICAKPK